MSDSSQNLETRVFDFFRSLTEVEEIDQIKGIDSKQGNRADFITRDRKFIIEIKSFHVEMKDKVQAFVDKLSAREEMPVFYGGMQVDKILEHFPEKESLREQLYKIVTSNIENIIRKANKQLRETKNLFNEQNAIGIVVVLNDICKTLDPKIVSHKISHLFSKKKKDGSYCYSSINAAWIMDENYSAKIPQAKVAYPSINLQNDLTENYELAGDFIQYLQQRLARRLKLPLIKTNVNKVADLKFEEATNIFNKISELPRHEIWRISYNKKPYLRRKSDEEVFLFGQNIFMELTPKFLIKSKLPKPSNFRTRQLLQQLTHFFEETSYRGIDMRRFQPYLAEAMKEV